MKAIRIHGSSGKATVSLDEIAVPEARPGEVLIRVRATAVTPGVSLSGIRRGTRQKVNRERTLCRAMSFLA